MHDSPSRSILLPSFLLALLLLTGILLFFRKPATTLGNLSQVASHAYELTLGSKAWPEGRWLFRGIPSPPAQIAGGVYDLYPYTFYTFRDTASGDAIIGVRSDVPMDWTMEDDPEGIVTGIHRDNGGTCVILVRNGESPSWPAALFSIITND